jgi:hypothetical protein
MRILSTLFVGLLISGSPAGCTASSQSSTEAAEHVAAPAVLQQIDRVSLLAWKETLGPKYPLTVLRADSVAMLIDFFDTGSATWTEIAPPTQAPMLAGFYRGGELQSERGFIEISHDQGGILIVRERGKVYRRAASAADIARFLSFFGVGVLTIPN